MTAIRCDDDDDDDVLMQPSVYRPRWQPRPALSDYKANTTSFL